MTLSDSAGTTPGDAVDKAALRRKYREERDKRLRADGNGQYLQLEGRLAHYLEDPYTPRAPRAARTDHVTFAFIGGGFAGLVTGARLVEAGIPDVRIVEKGGDFGGTWYWNRYPGAQCDIEAYIYLPLLEETGYLPKEKYSFAAEIREHAQRIGKTFDLYSKALFQTEINEIRWLDDDKRWLVTTNRGDVMKAKYVVMSSGPLNRPKLPGIPGMARFNGHSFHTSRWDYGYTGGNSDGGLTKLADKRVAIIGTGATAIQCVPHLARHAKHLYVFQRTPSSVDLRGNRPTDPAWAQSLTPGWQKRRMENFNTLVSGGTQDEDLVSDGWTDIMRKLGIAATRRKDVQMSIVEMAKAMEIADFKKMNEIRARVDQTVQDPKAAEALKPWYRQFCKRPTFNDDYLPTFNRPNVTLVDTQGRGVDEITETGLVFDGVAYDVDCIIFATGFEVGTSYSRRAGFEVIGREGETLTAHWADGIKTLHGISAHGFPNCFHMGITQNTLTPNFPHMLDEQARYIADVVHHAEERQAQTIEPSAEAEAGWCDTIRRLSIQSVQFQMDCTPGYYNGEGKPGKGRGFLDNLYGPGSVAFFDLARNWREKEGLEGLAFG